MAGDPAHTGLGRAPRRLFIARMNGRKHGRLRNRSERTTRPMPEPRRPPHNFRHLDSDDFRMSRGGVAPNLACPDAGTASVYRSLLGLLARPNFFLQHLHELVRRRRQHASGAGVDAEVAPQWPSYIERNVNEGAVDQPAIKADLRLEGDPMAADDQVLHQLD